MCGLGGVHQLEGGRKVEGLNTLANCLMLALQDRGRHATGYVAVMDSGKVQLEKAVMPASKFVTKKGRIREDARTVLVHTRWATVGAKEDIRNAHPVGAGTLAAVHNGTIYNDKEIFSAFGLERRTTVDSEVIPALINHAGWDQAEACITLMEGWLSTAVVDTTRPGEVFIAAQGGPIAYTVRPEGIVLWASTAKALRKAWRAAYGKTLRTRIHELPDAHALRLNGKAEVSELPQRFPISRTVGRAYGHDGGWQSAGWDDDYTSAESLDKEDYDEFLARETAHVQLLSGLDPEEVVDELVADGLTIGEARRMVYGEDTAVDQLIQDYYDGQRLKPEELDEISRHISNGKRKVETKTPATKAWEALT